MTILLIKDLREATELDGTAMAAIRGGWSDLVAGGDATVTALSTTDLSTTASYGSTLVKFCAKGEHFKQAQIIP